MHDAGDHVIVVGQVEEARRAETTPLVHWCGDYHQLTTEP